MIWLLWKLVTLPFRLVFGTIGLAFKTVRFVGVSRILAFGAGIGVGLATAPTTGEQFRRRMAERYAGGGTAAAPARSAVDALTEAVRDELANAPRTWHLPQPAVRVDGSRVTLSGAVPHEEARHELIRTAGAVVGVTAVDDHLTVTSI